MLKVNRKLLQNHSRKGVKVLGRHKDQTETFIEIEKNKQMKYYVNKPNYLQLTNVTTHRQNSEYLLALLSPPPLLHFSFLSLIDLLNNKRQTGGASGDKGGERANIECAVCVDSTPEESDRKKLSDLSFSKIKICHNLPNQIGLITDQLSWLTMW